MGSLNTGQTIDLSQCATFEIPGVEVIYTENRLNGECAGEYTLERSWIATDDAGNQVGHGQTITVVDNTAPIFCVLPESYSSACQPEDAAPLYGYDQCEATGFGASAWINEFHYDNTGGDVGEFFEVAGTAGTDLAGYTIELYNGSNGSLYNTINLSGIIPEEICGYGALDFQLPSNGIQNGGPDGFALVQDGVVVTFLSSYEGEFMAMEGTASGMMSTDIGVSEPGSTPIGQSLQLTGTGANGADFAWSGPSAASPGALNADQIMEGPLLAVLSENNIDVIDANNYTVERSWTLIDDCGNPAMHTQTIIVSIPTVVFPDLAPVCAGEQTITLTGGATPAGGVYSGLGVTDNADGTFDLDLSAVEPSDYTITYTLDLDVDCQYVEEVTLTVTDCAIGITDPCVCNGDNSPIIYDPVAGIYTNSK